MFGLSLLGLVGAFALMLSGVQFRPPSIDRKRSFWSVEAIFSAKAYTTPSPGAPTARVARPAPENPPPLFGTAAHVAPRSVETYMVLWVPQEAPGREPAAATAQFCAFVIRPALVWTIVQKT